MRRFTSFRFYDLLVSISALQFPWFRVALCGIDFTFNGDSYRASLVVKQDGGDVASKFLYSEIELQQVRMSDDQNSR